MFVALAVIALLSGLYYFGESLGLPFGRSSSLVSAGILEERDKVLIAAFENHTEDPQLNDAVQEALAIDFSQSPTFNAVSRSQVGETLGLMELPPETPLDKKIAHEVAMREGIKVMVEGSLRSLGSETIVSAQLVRVSDGEVLTAVQRSAKDEGELLKTVGEISRDLRKKIGESILSIQGTPPLEEVTTSSIRALQRYMEAVQANHVKSDPGRAIELLEEAIAIDPDFAMAHRKLGIILGNQNIDFPRQIEAYTKAYSLRHRLTERERLHTIASYEISVKNNVHGAINAYESILTNHPNDYIALNNLGLYYSFVREHEKSLAILNRAIAIDPSYSLFQNKVSALIAMDQEDSVIATRKEVAERFPGNPYLPVLDLYALTAFYHYDEAAAVGTALEGAIGGNLFLRREVTDLMGSIKLAQGNLVAAGRYWKTHESLEFAQDEMGAALQAALTPAFVELNVFKDSKEALRLAENALVKYPLGDIPVPERPYNDLIVLLSSGGEVDQARDLLEEYKRTHGEFADPSDVHEAKAYFALASGDLETAYEEFSLQTHVKNGWPDVRLGDILLEQGRTEEALRVYEELINQKFFWKLKLDARFRPGLLVQAAQIHEELGNPEMALSYYGLLLDMWTEPDPRLHPQIEFVQKRVNALAAMERTGS